MTTPDGKRSRLSAPARVLIALAIGAILGLGLALVDHATALQVADVAQPIGRLWLNALQMTVVPLVAALVVVGVNSASDAAASGRTARRAITVFVVLLLVASGFAALVAPAALSLLPRDAALLESLRSAFSGPDAGTSPPGIGDWLVGVIPSNAIAAASARRCCHWWCSRCSSASRCRASTETASCACSSSCRPSSTSWW